MRKKDVVDLRFAITGKDARFERLRELLLADGHECVDAPQAEVIIPPPWDPKARYARTESYRIANAALTAEAAAALLEKERPLRGARVLVLGWGRVGSLTAEALRASGAVVTAADRSAEKRVWATARGFAAAELDALDALLPTADVIVNTDPGTCGERSRAGPDEAECAFDGAGQHTGRHRCAGGPGAGTPVSRRAGTAGQYAPERAAAIVRDAVYETLRTPLPRLGVALTGSHCTFDKALEALEPLKGKYDLVPILSETAAGTDTYFGPAAEFRARLETLCGKKAVDSIVGAEPLGTREAMDALLVAPCTGNTLGKLAHGVTDTAVTMACKAHLRNARPLILAISTNDGLSGSASSIAALLQRKNVYFVPFRQDAPHTKPFSLQADFGLLEETLAAALKGKQFEPVLV